jgi:CRP-like cAMP-binding protein
MVRVVCTLAHGLECASVQHGTFLQELDVLYESGTQPSHVYFPTTSIVSLLYVMEDGSSAEIAVLGNDGIVGVAAIAAPIVWCGAFSGK